MWKLILFCYLTKWQIHLFLTCYFLIAVFMITDRNKTILVKIIFFHFHFNHCNSEMTGKTVQPTDHLCANKNDE